MFSVLVVTVSGKDRLGLVERLAGVVAENSGNWEHCRMVHLADRFVGLLQISVDGERQQDLEVALRTVEGLDVMIAATSLPAPSGPFLPLGNGGMFSLELLGSDHPGIVREIFSALSDAGVNVEELHTAIETAPDSGALLFRAQARLACPEGVDRSKLLERLESIAADIMVDIRLMD